jgi:hypothetical protein
MRRAKASIRFRTQLIAKERPKHARFWLVTHLDMSIRMVTSLGLFLRGWDAPVLGNYLMTSWTLSCDIHSGAPLFN